MGRAPEAILAYGYDLGEDLWHVLDTSVNELSYPAWTVDPRRDDDPIDCAERQLLAELVGFTETDFTEDGHFDRQREAEARLGVEFWTYGSESRPRFLLAAHVSFVMDFGEVGTIDMLDLMQRRESENWDEKLHAAMAALRITPLHEWTPAQWLLCSYMG
jgi:hypothetical protein